MEETSRRLGVSKTPLRDALLQLEMEGFVTILPRRKIVVNVLTLAEIRDIYEVIGALESIALLSAFDRIGEVERGEMDGLNAEMKDGHRPATISTSITTRTWPFPRRLPPLRATTT